MALFTVVFASVGAMMSGAVCSEDCVINCENPRVTLWGGKNIDVGYVDVVLLDSTLSFTFNSTDNWFMYEIQIYKYTCDTIPTKRPNPGNNPNLILNKSFTDTQKYEFSTKLAAAEVGTTVCFVTHVNVRKYDENREIIQQETSFGGNQNCKETTGSWFYYFCYDTSVICEAGDCWEGETAWAKGSRYVTNGNWAMYVAYNGEEKTVDLIAGQFYDVGDVTFSAPLGDMVIITITLNDQGQFQNVNENVKIQDYASAPSGNPNPGEFASKGTATGTSFSISVPVNNFYGVHVDVERKVECTE
ncbi:MAG: hypothetical protein HPY51_04695 [Candidatus Omnitrophica bacterium]|nr:hypothetical protein [Candidatus Omnitrophota bacterium]